MGDIVMTKSVSFTLALLGLGLVVPPAQAADSDCRSCHVRPAPFSKAKDYSAIYMESRGHHPIGVGIPVSAVEAYNQPYGVRDGLSFFDMNGNGIPDANEIQLFNGRVECASCHDYLHGDEVATPAARSNPFYLRITNSRSELCQTCHRR
jgi:hypothetical protein